MPFLASTTENTLCLYRYLVDSHWFKQWKKYVGFDSWDKYQMGEQNVYPGPVDNSGLLKGKKNKAQTIKPFCLHSHSKRSVYILLLRAKGNKSIVYWFQRVAYLGALSNPPAYLCFLLTEISVTLMSFNGYFLLAYLPTPFHF